MTTTRDVRAALGEWVNRVALQTPARLVLIAFGAVILVFTTLLKLPAATASGHSASFIDALFTATSAVCVTGLSTVNIATFWSPLGLTIIAIAIQVGGLGIMTLASLVGLAVSRRIGLT